MPEQVEVQHSGIARAWRQHGGADIWLQLRCQRRPGAVRRGRRAGQRRDGRPDGAEVVGVFGTGTGRGFAVQLIRADVAYALNPSALDDLRRQEAGWLVSPAATERIAALLDRRARRPAAEPILRQNLYSIAAQLPDAAPLLAKAVTETGMAGLDFVLDRNDADEHEVAALHTALSFGGEGVFQVIGGGWQRQVELLTEALVALPADTEQGYLRIATRNQISHDQIDAVQPLPGITEADVRYHKELLGEYLPDAHGVHVVRTVHCAMPATCPAGRSPTSATAGTWCGPPTSPRGSPSRCRTKPPWPGPRPTSPARCSPRS